MIFCFRPIVWTMIWLIHSTFSCNFNSSFQRNIIAWFISLRYLWWYFTQYGGKTKSFFVFFFTIIIYIYIWYLLSNKVKLFECNVILIFIIIRFWIFFLNINILIIGLCWWGKKNEKPIKLWFRIYDIINNFIIYKHNRINNTTLYK